MHGKGRFLKEIESVTIDLSNTCAGSGGKACRSSKIKKNFTSEMDGFASQSGRALLWNLTSNYSVFRNKNKKLRWWAKAVPVYRC